MPSEFLNPRAFGSACHPRRKRRAETVPAGAGADEARVRVGATVRREPPSPNSAGSRPDRHACQGEPGKWLSTPRGKRGSPPWMVSVLRPLAWMDFAAPASSSPRTADSTGRRHHRTGAGSASAWPPARRNAAVRQARPGEGFRVPHRPGGAEGKGLRDQHCRPVCGGACTDRDHRPICGGSRTGRDRPTECLHRPRVGATGRPEPRAAPRPSSAWHPAPEPRPGRAGRQQSRPLPW
jgi:hypothetical protein